MQLTTDRLIIRSFTMEDLDAYAPIVADPEVMKDIGDGMDFGWRYASAAWGNGYGTEAARAVLAYGLETLRLTTIYAEAYVENRGSLRIMQKLGLEKVGERIFHGRQVHRYEPPRP